MPFPLTLQKRSGGAVVVSVKTSRSGKYIRLFKESVACAVDKVYFVETVCYSFNFTVSCRCDVSKPGKSILLAEI